MYTILGANGIVATALALELVQQQKNVRLVSRNPKSVPGVTDLVSADLLDAAQTAAAVEGSEVVFLLAGLPYDHKLWAKQWPVVMRNTVEACKAAKAKLIFFDNVYMYGPVDGKMTENTPYRPSSKKGKVRAAIATYLMDEVIAGRITATIARCADFYGPKADKTGILNVLASTNLKKGSWAMWMGNDQLPHSFTYVPDAARALALLAGDNNTWNQVWHLPTAHPALNGKSYIEQIAREARVKPKYFKMGKVVISLMGLFSTQMGELGEMLYQYERPYLFDSTKFEQHFNFIPTTYEQGIAATIAG